VHRSIVVQYSVGPIVALHGRITARKYVDKLDNQKLSMIQMLFLNNSAVFLDDDAPIYTVGTVWFSHGLKSMKVNFSIFPGQQSRRI
jgi:hypothetical protein